MELLAISYVTYYIAVVSIGLSHGHAMRGKNVRDATPSDRLSFVVSIGKLGRPNSHFCTGTLISRSSVLTSEHCIVGENQNDIEITIGSADLRNGNKYHVAAWQTFQQWYYRTPELENTVDDIAVITLSERVNDSNVKPASMQFTDVQLLHCSRVRIAGWGLTNDGTVPMTLKTGVVKVISLEVCKERAKNITGQDYNVPSDYFCSAAQPWLLTSCGDSGAPILNKENQLIAINKGACPLIDEYPQDFQNRNRMNLHLHLLRYKNFINQVTIP